MRATRFAILLMRVLLPPLAWPRAVEAVEVTWGMLVSSSGQNVTDWWTQKWIDQYFEDGSKGDGVVSSNIVMVGTSCYFGDFEENFNNTLFEPVGGDGRCRNSETEATRVSGIFTLDFHYYLRIVSILEQA